MTQAFTRLRRKLGIDRPRVSFHSLRKNMGTALDRARVSQADVALILGHDRGFTLSVYAPLGLELPALKSIVEQARFHVDLRHLRRSAVERIRAPRFRWESLGFPSVS